MENQPDELKGESDEPTQEPPVLDDDADDASVDESVLELSPEKAADENKAGNEAFAAAKYQTALTHFSAAIQFDPTNVIFYSNRSRCFIELGQYELALIDAQFCMSQKPQWFKGYLRAGVALRKMNNNLQAQQTFERGLQVAPDNEDLRAGFEEASELVKRAATNAEDKKKRIMAIWADKTLTAAEKQKRIQELHRSTAGQTPKEKEAPKLPEASYQDEDQKTLGCAHYQRGCQIKAKCCGNFYPCRLCHDDAESHSIDRYATEQMYCMLCGTVQAVSNECSNAGCKREMAAYFCSKCRFWDNTPGKEAYHCDKCNICRRGKAEDYVHCDKCNLCILKSVMDDGSSHTCVANRADCNCPICVGYLFTSTRSMTFMRCGHAIHEDCLRAHMTNNITCPLCNKSLLPPEHMQRQWDQIEEFLSMNPMPEEMKSWTAEILCNDCLVKNIVPYHLTQYHKCPQCNGYNTKVLNTMKAPPGPGC